MLDWIFGRWKPLCCITLFWQTLLLSSIKDGIVFFKDNSEWSPMSTEKSWIGPGWCYLFNTEALLLPVQDWDELVTSLMKSIPVAVHFLQGHPMNQWGNWAENMGVASYKSNSSTISTQALGILKAFSMVNMGRQPETGIIWELIQNKVCSRSASADREQRGGTAAEGFGEGTEIHPRLKINV